MHFLIYLDFLMIVWYQFVPQWRSSSCFYLLRLLNKPQVFSKASEIFLGTLKFCKTTILLRWLSLSNCVAAGFCLEPRCLGGLTNKLLKGGFLGLYLSVNTPMGVPLHLAQALFAERSVSKVTNIPINDHLSHHDEKHHVKTRCQILCSMRLQCVSKNLTPHRMLNNWNCLSVGQSVPWSEPTNNQSLGSIK